ncbi:MAG: Crp/Fnr family transcriptional regulator [Bacteroidota bacterium]
MAVEEYQGLLDNIERYVSLTAAEKQQLTAVIRPVRIKKRQFIDQPGYVSLYRNYIVKGAFQSFLLDKDGKEHTVQIAVEDWFVSDFYSYITRTPATLFVEALEDAMILQLKYEDIEPLCSEIHALSEYFRVTTEKAFAYSRNRALSSLSMTAEERYLEFMGMYPGIAGRVPQRIIASYLGMTPEFLSKIRKGIRMES